MANIGRNIGKSKFFLLASLADSGFSLNRTDFFAFRICFYQWFCLISQSLDKNMIRPDFRIGFKGLPFVPSYKQAIYVENAFDECANNWIQANYDGIKKAFRRSGLEFCYLPLLAGEMSGSEQARYFAPYEKSATGELFLASDFMLDYMARPENRGSIPSSIIIYDDSETLSARFKGSDELVFSGVRLVPGLMAPDAVHDTFSYPQELADRLLYFSEDTALYRDGEIMVNEKRIEDADILFDEESQRIVLEIMERVDRLQEKGISRMVLEHMFREHSRFSRMVVSKSGQIILPDYGDMEIEMKPLPKAVYFLFLLHPEGIPFKALPDYRNELLSLYEKLRGGSLSDREVRSIADVTDPLSNSINEKCARIREAFVGKFDDWLAESYYITGKRGEPKGIMLDRKLVEYSF